MKHIIFAIILLILSGCSSVGKLPHFPEPPLSLTEDCQDLGVVSDGNEKLSEVLKVVTSNYGKYHECRVKVQLWNYWYSQQKQIYEGLNDNTR